MLRKALFINQSLTKLDLRGNGIDNKSVKFVESLLEINTYIHYIKQRISVETCKKEQDTLNVELVNAIELKRYLDKDKLLPLLQEIDSKVKFYHLNISPTPLEIILKAEKFLNVMNLYLSKSIGQTYLDSNEAVVATITQLKLPHQLYSFYQFIDVAETLGNITLSEEERITIKTYQENPNYFRNFIGEADLSTEAIIEFMYTHVEEAIQIQQLCKFFISDKNYSDIHSSFKSAILYYKNDDGFVISNSENSKLAHGCLNCEIVHSFQTLENTEMVGMSENIV